MKKLFKNLLVNSSNSNYIISQYISNIVSISLELLQKKANQADEFYKSCRCCGRQCNVDRTNQNPKNWGKCKTGMFSSVYNSFAHFGEEDCLNGDNGSGTIFFNGCNLECIFCQNPDLSQSGKNCIELGKTSDKQLAEIMVKLQKNGCHNINFVSPTHVVAPILRALVLAKQMELNLPLVYNTGGYDSVEILQILDGIIDIYIPDCKYSDKKLGLLYSGVQNYPQINKLAIKEMHRQVGILKVNEDGLAQRGLLIRHLVMPENVAGTEEIAKFLATEISKETYVNIMNQYRPVHEAVGHKILGRIPKIMEYENAVEKFREAGLFRFEKS